MRQRFCSGCEVKSLRHLACGRLKLRNALNLGLVVKTMGSHEALGRFSFRLGNLGNFWRRESSPINWILCSHTLARNVSSHMTYRMRRNVLEACCKAGCLGKGLNWLASLLFSQFGLVVLQTEIDVVVFGFSPYSKSSGLESREQYSNKLAK